MKFISTVLILLLNQLSRRPHLRIACTIEALIPMASRVQILPVFKGSEVLALSAVLRPSR